MAPPESWAGSAVKGPGVDEEADPSEPSASDLINLNCNDLSEFQSLPLSQTIEN